MKMTLMHKEPVIPTFPVFQRKINQRTFQNPQKTFYKWCWDLEILFQIITLFNICFPVASSEHPDEWTQWRGSSMNHRGTSMRSQQDLAAGLKMLRKCIKRLSQNVWITCYKVAKDTQKNIWSVYFEWNEKWFNTVWGAGFCVSSAYITPACLYSPFSVGAHVSAQYRKCFWKRQFCTVKGTKLWPQVRDCCLYRAPAAAP